MTATYPTWRTAPIRWLAKLLGVSISFVPVASIKLVVDLDTSELKAAIAELKALQQVHQGECASAELASTEDPMLATLDDLLAEQRRTNELLENLNRHMDDTAGWQDRATCFIRRALPMPRPEVPEATGFDELGMPTFS